MRLTRMIIVLAGFVLASAGWVEAQDAPQPTPTPENQPTAGPGPTTQPEASAPAPQPVAPDPEQLPPDRPHRPVMPPSGPQESPAPAPEPAPEPQPEAPAPAPEPATEPQPEASAPAPAPAPEPATEPQPEAPAPAPAPAPAVQEPVRDIVVQWNGAEAMTVVRRMAQLMGKQPPMDANIPGTITFFDSQERTIDEAFDLLNMMLAMRGSWMAVKGPFLEIVPANQASATVRRAILFGTVPDDAQDAEFVTILLPLSYATPELIKPVVLQLMSAYGSLLVLPTGRGILISDHVANIKSIKALLAVIDTSSIGGEFELETLELKQAPARDVANTINQLYGPNAIDRPMIRDPRNPNRRIPGPIDPKAVVVTTFDARTNTLYFKGVRIKLDLAMEMARNLDRGGSTLGDFKSFKLDRAKAEDVASRISQLMVPGGRQPQGAVPPRIVPEPITNRILVTAQLDDMAKIEAIIEELDENWVVDAGAKIVRLKVADAATLAPIIQATSSSTRDPRGRLINNVNVVPEVKRNLLILSGSPQDIAAAENIIAQLDGEMTVTPREVRIIHLENGDVRQIAQNIINLLTEAAPGGRGRTASTDKFRIAADPSSNNIYISATEEDWAKIDPILERIKELDGANSTTTRTIAVKYADLQQLQGIVRSSITKMENRRSVPAVNVVFETKSRKMVISGPPAQVDQAVALAEEIDGDAEEKPKSFHVIHLASGDVRQVAQNLINLLTQDPRRRGAGDTFRIEADQSQNNIYISATEEDWQQIKPILDDIKTVADAETMLTRTIKVQNADLQQLQGIVRSSITKMENRRSVPAVNVVFETNSRKMVISGPPEQVDQAVALAEEIDSGVEDKPKSFHVIHLASGDVRQVAQNLINLLTQDPRRRGAGDTFRIEADQSQNNIYISATEEDWQQIKPILDDIKTVADAETMLTRTIKVQNADLQQLQGIVRNSITVPDRGRLVPAVNVVYETNSRKMVISGPPERVDEAVALVAEIDIEPDPNRLVTTRTYELRSANANDLARSLERLFAQGRNERQPRFQAEQRSNQLIISASEEQFLQIEPLIKNMEERAAKDRIVVKTFRLVNAQADNIVQTVTRVVQAEMRAQERVTGSRRQDFQVSADSRSNILVVTAPAGSIETVEQLIATLDIVEVSKITTVIVELEKANPIDMGNAINAALTGGSSPGRRGAPQLQGLTGRKLVVVPNADTRAVLLTGTRDDIDFATDIIKKLDARGITGEAIVETYKVQFADATAIADTLTRTIGGAQARGNRRNAPAQMPTSIVANQNSNSIVVSGNEALHATVKQVLVELDTPDAASAVTVELVRLDNAKADELATALNNAAGLDPRRGRQNDQVLATAHPGSNMLLLTGRKDDVARQKALVENLDKAQGQLVSVVKTYQLKFAKATLLAEAIEPMLSESSTSSDPRQRIRMVRAGGGTTTRVVAYPDANAIMVQAPPDKIALAEQIIATFDVPNANRAGEMAIQVITLINTQAASVAEAVTASLQASFPGGRRPNRNQASSDDVVTVTAEPFSNTIIVRGPALEVPAVVALVKELDNAGVDGGLTTKVRIYKVEHGFATTVAKDMGDFFTDMIRQMPSAGRNTPRPTFTIQADVYTNTLLVSTTPVLFAVFEDLLKKIESAKPAPLPPLHYVPLVNADADIVAGKLEMLFANRSVLERPVIEPDYFDSSITIIATDEDFEKMQPIIDQMDKPVYEIRVISVAPFKPEQIIEQLLDIYPLTSGKPIEAVDKMRPGGGNGSSSQAPQSDSPTNEPGSSLPAGDEAADGGTIGQVTPAEVQQAAVVAPGSTGRKEIIISATRKEMMALRDLIYELTRGATTGEPEFRWFPVVYADPAEMADMLDALFNPTQRTRGRRPQPQQPQNNQQNRGGQQPNRGGQQPQQQPAAPTPMPTITVVPNQRTRSVIVRAKPVDFDLVEMVIKQLDQPNVVITEVRTFLLKNTDATQVANNLEEIFRLASSPARTTGNRQGGNPQQQRAEEVADYKFTVQNPDGTTSQVNATAMVSVSANTATNSVIVAAPKEAMEVIAGIIREIDQSVDPGTQPVVRIYPVDTDDVSGLASRLSQIFSTQATPAGGRGGRGAAPAASRTQVPIIFTADDANHLLVVSASVDQHELIAKTLDELKEKIGPTETTVEVYKIVNTTAQNVATALLGTMVTGTTTGGGGRRRPTAAASAASLKISADQTSNSLVVRATKEQHVEIAELIAKIDTKPGGDWPVRTIVLNHADAANIASLLSGMYGSGGGGRNASTRSQGVTISGDANSRKLLVRADDETYNSIRELAMALDIPAGNLQQMVVQLENAPAQSVASAITSVFRTQGQPRATAGDMVTASAEASTNTVIVSASEAKMSQVRELIAELDKPIQGRRTDYIILKNAKADELAKVLGATVTTTGGRNASAGTTVSPLASTNTIVVSGSTAEVDRLMALALQLDQAPPLGGMMVHLMPLDRNKGARADQMAALVEDLYAKQTAVLKPTGIAIEPMAVVGDTQTNTLIFTCSDETYKQVQVWVNTLIEMGPLRTNPRIIRIEAADPNAVKEAIDALLNGGAAPPRTNATGSGEVTLMSQQLLVDVSDEDYEKIKALVEMMDQAARENKQQVKVLALEFIDSAILATSLQQIFAPLRDPSRPETTVTARPVPNTKAIMIAASKTMMEDVLRIAKELDSEKVSPKLESKPYPLENAIPSKVLPQLNQMLTQYRQANPNEPISVFAYDAVRSVVVTARPETQAIVAKMLTLLDTQPPTNVADGNILVIPLRKANAPLLAGVLRAMLQPSPTGNVTPEALALQEQIRRLRVVRGDSGTLGELDLTKPIKIESNPASSGQEGANALIITSTPENLTAMAAIVELMDTVPLAADVKVQIVHLQNADASSVLTVLQEIFRLGGQTLAGRPGTSVATKAEPENLTGDALVNPLNVSADLRTNTMVLSGKQETIVLAELIIKDLDREEIRATTEVQMFKLKYADVTRMMPILQAVFTEQAAGTATAQSEGVRTMVTRMMTKLGDGQTVASDWPKTRAALTIQADTGSNTLVVAARSDMMPLIVEVIKALDVPNAGSLALLHLIELKNADATRMRTMLNELYTGPNSSLIRADDVPTITVDTRTNMLIVWANEATFAALADLAARLDAEGITPASDFRVFMLTHRTATRLQPMIQQVLAARPAVTGVPNDPVTVLADAQINALIVGASREDMKIAEDFIARLDVDPGEPGHAIRVIPLKKANAPTVVTTLEALYQSQGGTSATGVDITADARSNVVIASGGSADLDRIELIIKQLDREEVAGVNDIRVFQLHNADATELSTLLNDLLTNKPPAMTTVSADRVNLLEFILETPEGKTLITRALHEGVTILPLTRNNILVVLGPKEFIPLLESLVTALDSVEPPTAQIRTFKLVNADATQMMTVLQELFRLTATASTGSQAVRYVMRTPVADTPGEAPTDGAGVEETLAANLGTAEQYALTVTVDTRTNVLLLGGTEQYINLAGKVISDLDAMPAQSRREVVFTPRNAQAADIATAIRTWLDQERASLVNALGSANMGAAHRLLEREVAIVAETTSNRLLISASPRYFDTIDRMIRELDAQPPQVLIKVLLAEVLLDDRNELGFDWDLAGATGGSTIALGTSFGASSVGSGFNLSVTGSDLEFFLRALQSQGRLEVLNRPQINATDNIESVLNVGQEVPYVSFTQTTADGRLLNTISRQQIGIILQVTPRINPDGFIRMDVMSEVSSISDSTVQITEGLTAEVFNRTTATTTVTVRDGHTIVIGGMIGTRNANREDKVPLLGDLPWLGMLFKRTTVVKERRELLIILTPQIQSTTPVIDSVADREIAGLDRFRGVGRDAMAEYLFNPLGNGSDATGNDDLESERDSGADSDRLNSLSPSLFVPVEPNKDDPRRYMLPQLASPARVE